MKLKLVQRGTELPFTHTRNKKIESKDVYKMEEKDYLIQKMNLLENKLLYLRKDFNMIKNKYK